jgi:hypothetical protein
MLKSSAPRAQRVLQDLAHACAFPHQMIEVVRHVVGECEGEGDEGEGGQKPCERQAAARQAAGCRRHEGIGPGHGGEADREPEAEAPQQAAAVADGAGQGAHPVFPEGHHGQPVQGGERQQRKHEDGLVPMRARTLFGFDAGGAQVPGHVAVRAALGAVAA